MVLLGAGPDVCEISNMERNLWNLLEQSSNLGGPTSQPLPAFTDQAVHADKISYPKNIWLRVGWRAARPREGTAVNIPASTSSPAKAAQREAARAPRLARGPRKISPPPPTRAPPLFPRRGGDGKRRGVGGRGEAGGAAAADHGGGGLRVRGLGGEGGRGGPARGGGGAGDGVGAAALGPLGRGGGRVAGRLRARLPPRRGAPRRRRGRPPRRAPRARHGPHHGRQPPPRGARGGHCAGPRRPRPGRPRRWRGGGRRRRGEVDGRARSEPRPRRCTQSSAGEVPISGCIDHWPARTKWKDIKYLQRTAGDRTVPVEVGKNYVCNEWKQELITFSQFLERMWSPDCSANLTYLAQHPLFDQIKELREDILVPEYCHAGGGELQSLNAWIGPHGTVTPLHHDPHHNLFAQVLGRKYIRLYPASISEDLYPHTETMLSNTSQVDLDNIDVKEYPRTEGLEFIDGILEEGDLLYIPPKWWHYMNYGAGHLFYLAVDLTFVISEDKVVTILPTWLISSADAAVRSVK